MNTLGGAPPGISGLGSVEGRVPPSSGYEHYQLVLEYLQVTFTPAGTFTHRELCPLRRTVENLQPTDVAVLIDGVCQGFVGELIVVTSGTFEVSIDVDGAETRIVEMESTTPKNPKQVAIVTAVSGTQGIEASIEYSNREDSVE